MKAQYVSAGTSEYFVSLLALENSVEGPGSVAPFDLSLLPAWTVPALGSVQDWGFSVLLGYKKNSTKKQNSIIFFSSFLL